MVQLSENEGSNQQRGNKRPFSNTGDDNQGARNPRGDQGGKFQRRSFGDRSPFNKSGDRPFNNGNRFNRGGPFNKDNNFNRGRNQNFGQGRDNQNFNRGRNNQHFQDRNNQNFRQGGFQNNRFNKSWEGNKSDNAPDFEQNDNVTKHKKFDEEIEEAANTIDTQPKHKKSKNVEQNEAETSSSDSDQEVELQKSQETKQNEEEELTSSESEEDIETNANLQKNQNVSKNEDVEDETSSESEKEIEPVSKTVQKVSKNEDEETSSSEDEEETVTNSNNVQNNQNKDKEDKESKDKIEGNNSEEQQVEKATAEANTSTKKQNRKTKNFVSSRRIIVNYLPASATEQQIQKFFERYGKIESITFQTTEKSADADIVFKKEEDAEKAVEVNGMIYKNRRLNVFICKNQRKPKDRSMSIFVNEIPNGITKEDLWDVFESTYGPIRTISLPKPTNGNSHRLHKGYAIIDFYFMDSKKLAITDKQIKIKGKILKVTESQEQEKSDRTPRVYNGRIQKFEPRRFTGGPRYSGPRNSYEPRDFAGRPGNIQVHNTPGKSITITLGNDSFPGQPSFNGRPKFNPRNSFKGHRQ